MTGTNRRAATGAMALLLAALLSACLLMPGKFTSDLDVRRDGTFSFRYTGGITLLPLAMPNARPTFEAETCHDEATAEERTCTAEEIAEQKTAFEKRQSEKARSDAQAAQVLFGGIDPGSPGAAEEIAARLRRQKGWKSVEYKGDGLFEVDFAISGRLDHDFAFPTIERFPAANAFVQVGVRQDGTVRIDAPGFSPSSSMMGAAAMMGGSPFKTDAQNAPPGLAAEGTFTVRTDGAVLANNTDEGPAKAPGGQALIWKVNPRTPAAPTALIRLGS